MIWCVWWCDFKRRNTTCHSLTKYTHTLFAVWNDVYSHVGLWPCPSCKRYTSTGIVYAVVYAGAGLWPCLNLAWLQMHVSSLFLFRGKETMCVQGWFMSLSQHSGETMCEQRGRGRGGGLIWPDSCNLWPLDCDCSDLSCMSFFFFSKVSRLLQLECFAAFGARMKQDKEHKAASWKRKEKQEKKEKENIWVSVLYNL